MTDTPWACWEARTSSRLSKARILAQHLEVGAELVVQAEYAVALAGPKAKWGSFQGLI